jgi:type IV secretion system protein VirB9
MSRLSCQIGCHWARAVIAVLFLILGLGSARAETLPAKGSVDNRVRTTAYNPDEVYKLYGFVGYAIELIFEEGETFSGAGGGDLGGVTIDAHANSVLLKPKAAIVSTNLVIFTDRRAYRFDYSVAARRPNRLTDEVMYAVRFVYPPRPGDAKNLQAQVDRDLERAKSARARNTDYWYCGQHALKPVAASDDGVQTRLTFSDRAEIPAIFVRNEDGTESLLNFSMDEGDVVIHRLAPRLILRRGRLTGCVVNKAFNGAGSRLESGTVSPQIQRDSKEPRP